MAIRSTPDLLADHHLICLQITPCFASRSPLIWQQITPGSASRSPHDMLADQGRACLYSIGKSASQTFILGLFQIILFYTSELVVYFTNILPSSSKSELHAFFLLFFLLLSLLLPPLPKPKKNTFCLQMLWIYKEVFQKRIYFEPSLSEDKLILPNHLQKKQQKQKHQESKLYFFSLIVYIFPFKFWQVCAGLCMLDLISMDAGVACTSKFLKHFFLDTHKLPCHLCKMKKITRQ